MEEGVKHLKVRINQSQTDTKFIIHIIHTLIWSFSWTSLYIALWLDQVLHLVQPHQAYDQVFISLLNRKLTQLSNFQYHYTEAQKNKIN